MKYYQGNLLLQTIGVQTLMTLPRAAKIVWDFVGPIVIGKIKNEILG